MSEVKRYEPAVRSDRSGLMVEHAGGNFVEYAMIGPILTALEAEVKAQRERAERWKAVAIKAHAVEGEHQAADTGFDAALAAEPKEGSGNPPE